jgi:chromosome partitioning protein
MSIISFAIQKGGSGKTTSVINLAAALQQQGKKILLVDADPQSNLTQSLGIIEETGENLFTELKKETEGKKKKDEIPAIIALAGGLHLIPSSIELAGAELELVNVYGREQLISWILKPLENEYDFIFIDCPPSISMLTVNALVASRYVLMPLQAEYLPLKGVRSFMHHCGHVQKIKRKLGLEIDILGFILTKFDEHKKMNRDVCRQLEEEFGSKVFKTHIRTNIQLAKAQEAGLDIFNFDKHSHGASDYMELSKEFLSKIE